MTKIPNVLVIENWNLEFALRLAQGGESFDFAQDREPVERLVEPFGAWDLGFEICPSGPPSPKLQPHPVNHIVRPDPD